MTLTVVNRIADLQDAYRAVADKSRAETAMAQAAQTPALKLWNQLRNTGPQGSNEPSYGNVAHGRPSLRIWGRTLDSGWLPPLVERAAGGASATIVSTAPQIMLLLHGSPPHSIPGPNSFWWGSPLKWSPKDGRAPGPRYFSEIKDHPGFKPFTFVLQAINLMRSEFIAAHRRGVREITRPLREFFRK